MCYLVGFVFTSCNTSYIEEYRLLHTLKGDSCVLKCFYQIGGVFEVVVLPAVVQQNDRRLYTGQAKL